MPAAVQRNGGCNPETLRCWGRQAERDEGKRPGLTTDEREQIKAREREVRELRESPHAVACDDNGLAVFDPGFATGATMARSSWLPTQEDSSELLLIAEPVLGLRNRRSERLCDGFLCDHPRSLDGRVRNDAADCADADECNPDCNNQSNGELLAATHGGPPSFERALGAPHARMIAGLYANGL
jgi:hypothetical protein